MTETTLFLNSSVSVPRAKIVVAGLTLGGLVEASVTSNAYYAADKWSAKIALGPDSDRDAKWWGDQDEIECEIFFSTDDGKNWKSFILGTADRIRVEESQGLIVLDGQDFTAKLIREYIIDDFSNLSAADIARKFAAKHGLEADVDDTPGLVGQMYSDEHTGLSTGQFSRQTTEWDYLSELAQHYEGYQVWVKGRTLHFKKPPEPDKLSPFVIKYNKGNEGNFVRGPNVFNAKTLVCERDLTRSKDIEVIVRSWHGSKATQFQVTARRKGGGLNRGHKEKKGRDPSDPLIKIPLVDTPDENSTEAQLSKIPGWTPRKKEGPHNDKAPEHEKGLHRYIIERPNLSLQEAEELAQAKLKEATLHEREITVTIPGELELDPRTLVKLTGHGTSWDQDYYIKEIERKLSIKGFDQTIIAKNESPGGTTIVTSTAT